MTADRYHHLAETLLASDDPVTAIAHELGDHAGRLEALARRIDHVEAALDARPKPGDTR